MTREDMLWDDMLSFLSQQHYPHIRQAQAEIHYSRSLMEMESFYYEMSKAAGVPQQYTHAAFPVISMAFKEFGDDECLQILSESFEADRIHAKANDIPIHFRGHMSLEDAGGYYARRENLERLKAYFQKS